MARTAECAAPENNQGRDEWMTVIEMQQYMRASRNKAYDLIWSGEIDSYRSSWSACGMESGMGAEASRHGMRSVGGCWAPVGLETTPRRERRRVPESRCRGPHRDGIPRAACGQYAHGIAVARWFSMRNGYGAAQHVRRKKEDSQ